MLERVAVGREGHFYKRLISFYAGNILFRLRVDYAETSCNKRSFYVLQPLDLPLLLCKISDY